MPDTVRQPYKGPWWSEVVWECPCCAHFFQSAHVFASNTPEGTLQVGCPKCGGHLTATRGDLTAIPVLKARTRQAAWMLDRARAPLPKLEG